MDWTAISIIAGAAAAVIGSIAIVAKNFDTIAEVYVRRIKQPAEKRKQAREDESHRPLHTRLDRIERETRAQMEATEESLADIKQMLEDQKQDRAHDRRITLASAMALVSLYTDLHIRGEPNGKTETDIQKLRELIYR